MKIHKTNKLFYGKYPFRIEVQIKGGDTFARNQHDLKRTLYKISDGRYYKGFEQRDLDNLTNYSLKYAELDRSKFKERVEGHWTKFYTENRADHDFICSKLEYWITRCNEPEDDDLVKLLDKKNIILRTRLPHGGFQFRIILKHQIPQSRRISFFGWLKNYIDDTRMTPLTQLYLQGRDRYSEGYSIYIRNEKLLMMIALFLGNDVKKVEEYVLRDTQINSVPEEESCQI